MLAYSINLVHFHRIYAGHGHIFNIILICKSRCSAKAGRYRSYAGNRPDPISKISVEIDEIVAFSGGDCNVGQVFYDYVEEQSLKSILQRYRCKRDGHS